MNGIKMHDVKDMGINKKKVKKKLDYKLECSTIDQYYGHPSLSYK